MSLEENKALVRRFTENVWNQGKLELLDEIFAPGYVTHKLQVLPHGSDREGYRQWVIDTRKAFPDFHASIEDMMAEGDKVTYRYMLTGTNTGGSPDYPATGKRIETPGFGMYRVQDGKIVEGWIVVDNLIIMQQQGFIPAPGGQPALK